MENIPESLSFDSEFKIPGMEESGEQDGSSALKSLMNWEANMNPNGAPTTTTSHEEKKPDLLDMDESVTEMKRQMLSAMLGPVDDKGQLLKYYSNKWTNRPKSAGSCISRVAWIMFSNTCTCLIVWKLGRFVIW